MPVIIYLTSGYSLTHTSGGPTSGVHRRESFFYPHFYRDLKELKLYEINFSMLSIFFHNIKQLFL
jgi:hypothetical protein